MRAKLGNPLRPLFRAGFALSGIACPNAFAQGIVNPMGGGVIPIMFYTLIGYPLLAYVLIGLATKYGSGNVRALRVMIPLIVLYVLIGFLVTYVPERNEWVLHLYVVLLLLIVGTTWLGVPGLVARVLVIDSALALIAVLNFFHPKLIDFRERVYIDNTDTSNQLAVSYPGHWREMHLEDGRVLLNVNPHRRYGGTMRMNADRNKIASPITLSDEGDGIAFNVFNSLETYGTNGWKNRPRSVFTVPLLGTAEIPRFENQLAGKALLLDDNAEVACRYLHAARGEPVPSTASERKVIWSVERSIESQSIVECER